MDGHITEAAAAMETACDEAFAMVGGGLVLDDQEFPRFNECGMIDFAGYTVTAAKALSSGMIQPIPNPPNTKPSVWWQWGAETYPDAVKNTALIYQQHRHHEGGRRPEQGNCQAQRLDDQVDDPLHPR